MIHLASLLKQRLRHEGCVSVVIGMTNLLFNLHFQAYRAETSKACLTGKISSQKGTKLFNTFHSPKRINYSNQPKVIPIHQTVNQVIIKEKKKSDSIFLLASLPIPSIQTVTTKTRA